MLRYPLILVRSLLHFFVYNNVWQCFFITIIFGDVAIAVVAVFRFVSGFYF